MIRFGSYWGTKAEAKLRHAPIKIEAHLVHGAPSQRLDAKRRCVPERFTPDPIFPMALPEFHIVFPGSGSKRTGPGAMLENPLKRIKYHGHPGLKMYPNRRPLGGG